MSAAWLRDVLRATSDPSCTRDDVAAKYAEALRVCGPSEDWHEVNRAIIARWSMAGLRYIKTSAWKVETL